MTVSYAQYPQKRPNGLWRGMTAMTMGFTTTTAKFFLYGFNNAEVLGLDKFLELLASRQDPFERHRGLITVSNHMSVYVRIYSISVFEAPSGANFSHSVDDPLLWGVLPIKYLWEPWNLRWGLGAHDICFANKLLSTFFTLGQVLPVHRNLHSPHAGLYQPTMTQAIRLLSAYPFKTLPNDDDDHHPTTSKQATISTLLADLRDPFSDGSLTYSTTGSDVHTAPSAFLSNRHAWVHVFPEGLVHQHPDRHLRYFKWGVARLILEAEPMPDLVPMFIDGTCDVMHESRGWPRPAPRPGQHVKVVFGNKVDMEATFGDMRRKWKALVRDVVEKRAVEIQAVEETMAEMAERERALVSDKALAADRNAGRHGILSADQRKAARLHQTGGLAALKKPDVWRIGDLPPELRDTPEVVAIRIEVTRRVREEVLKVRRSVGGYPEEKPEWKLGLAQTWARDHHPQDKV